MWIDQFFLELTSQQHWQSRRCSQSILAKCSNLRELRLKQPIRNHTKQRSNISLLNVNNCAIEFSACRNNCMVVDKSHVLAWLEQKQLNPNCCGLNTQTMHPDTQTIHKTNQCIEQQATREGFLHRKAVGDTRLKILTFANKLTATALLAFFDTKFKCRNPPGHG